jgi:hypothetical protein
VQFWLKTSSSVAVAVALNEKEPGGRYVAVVWSPANTWQRVQLALSDFALSDGPNDPKDPDGKLDPENIQGIGIVDVSQLFSSAAGAPPVPIVIDARTGRQSIFLDDFEISSEAPPNGAGPSVIDSFDRPFLRWMTLGGADLSVENLGEAPGMRARYQQIEDRLVVILRPLPKTDFRGSQRLAFDIASDHDAQLVLAFEERSPGKQQGPRYATTVDILGGGKPEHRSIVLSAFDHDPNSADDPNGRLDLDQIKSISLVDITATATQETAKNSLWISAIRMEK